MTNSCYAKCPSCQLNSCSNGPDRRSSFYRQSARPDKDFKGAASVSQNRRRPFETLVGACWGVAKRKGYAAPHLQMKFCVSPSSLNNLFSPPSHYPPPSMPASAHFYFWSKQETHCSGQHWSLSTYAFRPSRFLEKQWPI